MVHVSFVFFFFQAEDGIRDYKVTGVQTCALPISSPSRTSAAPRRPGWRAPTSSPKCSTSAGCPTRSTSWSRAWPPGSPQIGRASCRERVQNAGGAAELEKKRKIAYEGGSKEIIAV